MVGVRSLRLTALLGDEAKLGQRDDAGDVWPGPGPLARPQHVAQVGLGEVELALPARGLA
jgi:hypothetical protein